MRTEKPLITLATRRSASAIIAFAVVLAVMALTAAPALATYSNTRATGGQTYAPERSISFAVGTHVGYKFDSYGAQTASKSTTIGSSSSAPASHRRYINSVWYYFITAGTFDNYWVPDNATINAYGDPTVSTSRTVNVTVNWAGNGVNPGTITIYYTQSAGSPSPTTATSCGTLSPAAQNGDYHTKTCSLPSDGTWKFFTVGVGEAAPGSYDSTVFVDTVDPAAPSLTCSSCSATDREHQNVVNGPIYLRTAGLIGTQTLGVSGTSSDPAPSSGLHFLRFNALSSTTGWTYAQTTPFNDTASPYSEGLDYTVTTASTTQVVHAVDDGYNQSANRTLTVTVDNLGPQLTWVSPTASEYRAAPGSITFDWNDSDAAAGVDTRTAWIESAELTNGICGTFSAVGPPSYPSTSETGYVPDAENPAEDRCYRAKVILADNVANTTTSDSPEVVFDSTAPTHSTSTDAATDPTSHQVDDEIWFRSTTSGQVALTVDGTDAESGVAGATLESVTGWAVFEPGDPTEYGVAWGAYEALFTVDVSVDNRSGLSSPVETLTFRPDAADPTLAVTAPAAGTALSSSDDVTATWSEGDADAGVASRSVQRLAAPATNGECGSFTNDGSATTAAAPREDAALPSGFCYRYQITVTDHVGLSTTASSGTVLVDTDAPEPVFSSPTDDTQQIDSTFAVAWTDGAGDAGLASRSLQRQVADATNGSCGTFAADGPPTTNASPRSDSGLLDAHCYRWVIRVINGAGSTGQAISDTVLVDASAPTLTIIAPEPETTTPTDSISAELSWTESAPSGITTRSVQRYVAPATDGDCGILDLDGAPTVGASPRSDSDLISGNCYRWRVELTNGVDATTSDHTGVVLVDTGVPSGEFSVPAEPMEGDIVWEEDGILDVTWSEVLPASGLVSRSLQHQTAPLVGIGACGTFVDTGASSSAPSPVAVSLEGAICHRWVLTMTSGSGLASTITSAPVAVSSGAPVVDFETPETDREILFESDFEGGTMPTGWPGALVTDASGNHFVDGAGKDTTSPQYPVSPGDLIRVSIRVQSSGPWSWSGMCFKDAAGATIGECSPRTNDGDANDTLAVVSMWLAVAPTNASSVIVYFYNSWGPGQYDDVSIERLWTPTSARQPVTQDVDLTWTEDSDAIVERSLQREVAPADSLFHCRRAIFGNDGSALSNIVSPIEVTGLDAGYCYRWTLTATDVAGQNAVAHSGVVYIDPAPPPGADFSAPDEDMETIFRSDFTDPDEVIGWPGGEVLVGGDYQRSLGGITDMYYGPKFESAPGEHLRWSARAFPAGPHAWFGLCFYRADNTEISCPSGARIAEGDHRATLEIREADAPPQTAFVAIQFYHAYNTSYYDDITIERVLTASDVAVQLADQATIAWIESVPTDGVAIATRRLQRQVADATSLAGCDIAAFTDDGAAVTDLPPVSVTGLLDDKCYRWVLTLTDVDGSTSQSVSGVRYVVPHQLDLHHVPHVGLGNSASISVVVSGRDGEPLDDFVGTLTVSTDDPDTTFPGGASYALDGADDQTGHTFEVRFGTPGEHTLSVRATNAELATSTIEVTDTELTASAPETVYAGVPFVLEVAPTSGGQYDPRYSGTVEFASSDTTATYSRTTGTPPTFVFECNCDGAETFATRLTTLGSQTVTVSDDFGNTDTVAVTVVAAPGAIAAPVQRIDRVKWDHGSAVDWYLTAVDGAQPFTVIEATNSCNQPASGVGLRIVPTVDRYVEFTSSVSKQICDDMHLSDISHTLLIIDDAGHSWTLGANHYGRFAAVPNSGNFRMLDPGDPMSYYQVTGRPGGTERATGPDDRSWAYGRDSLAIEFFVHEPTSIIELYLGRPGISGYVQPWQSPMTRQLPVGQSFTSFDDITHTCYIGGSWQGASSGWIKYGTASGRSGARASGGGILPGAGTPSATCSTPVTGDDGGPLDDLMDALNPDNWPLVGDVNRFMAGDPVDPFTGGFTQSITDFSLGGMSPSLQLSRTYRADRAEKATLGDANAVGAFGPGWGSSVDQRLFIIDDGSRIEWRASDGGVSVFVEDASGGYGGTRIDVTLTASAGNYRLETNSGSALLFDGSGRMTAIEDRDGRQLTLAHDGNGYLDSMTDAAGRSADFTVDGSGRVTRVDLPDGRYVAFTYADGYLASARSLSGTVIRYVTDNRGRMTELRDASEVVLLRNIYDDRGRVISQEDASGDTTWFVYDADGLMTQVIDPRGAVTTDCFLATGQLDHRIDALGSTTRYTYDSAGNPSTTTDALGRVTTFDYNDDGLPIRVTDPLGRTQGITYNADNLVTAVTDHTGATVTPTYDANGRPTSVTRAEPTSDPDPQSLEVATYTYNALGLPQTITAPGGAGATMSYSTAGYLTGITDAEGRQIAYTVDARGFVTAMVNPLGTASGGTPSEHTSSYSHDDAGRVLTATNTAGETTTNAYDEMGRLLTTTSPLGTVTTNAYDHDGRVLSITTQLTDTATATTTFDYDAAGNLIRVTDAEWRETEFEYDLLGRQTLKRDPNGEEWLTEYDALGRVIETTDPTGRTSQSLYDAAGRVSKSVDAAGEETTYAYSDRDQLVTVTDPLGRITTNTYDWLGRQTDLTNAEEETTISAFDDAGDLVSLTDAEGKTTTFSYDDTHRPLEVVDAATGSTIFEYDAAGRLIERTNAGVKSETFSYDVVGRQTSTTDALGNVWTTSYDADGRIDFTGDGKGQTSEFTFDRAGRLLSVDPAGAMAPVTYTYDDTGRQLTMNDGEGSSTFVYDAVGRITAAARDSQTVGYTYDAAGRPTSVIYPSGSGSVDYTYDGAGRLATINDWSDRTTTISYDDASRVTSLARPGGLTTNFAYDDVDRLLGIDHLQGGSPLLALDYTYDDVGNVATYTDDSGTASFGYNDLHQLTSADYPGTNDFAYSYDAVGNMTEMVGPTGTLTRSFNDGDQVVSETATGSFGETIVAGAATGGWADMGNVDASDDVDASAAPDAATTLTMSTADFDFAAIPADALISEATINVEWASSLATAELTLGAQARVDGTLVGTETTETANPTTDTVASFAVADLDRAGLELLSVDVRATRAAGDAVTASVDAVTVEVTYTLPPRSFTYDDNGSMTDDGASRSFTYDALGRLTGVSGAVDATYAYDGAGRRISATVDTVTTDDLLDVRGLGSVLSDGTRSFLPGAPNLGHEEGGAWVSGLTNQQGSVLGYADGTGLAGSLTQYDPYGAPLPGSTSLPAGPGFTGEWSDASGLVDLRFRAYDPSLQSFFGRDSFGGVASAPLSANRYAYAMGNPLRFTDPSGHFVNEFMRDPGLYLSISLQMIPAIGDAYSFATGALGFDPIAGMSLSGLERGLAMAAIGPGGGFHLMGRLGNRAGDTVADVTGRSLDNLGGLGRSADSMGGVSRSGDNLAPVGSTSDNARAAGRSGGDRGSGARGSLSETNSVPDGLVYRRTDLNGGKPYIGQARSETRFIERQREHARANPTQDFEFEVLGRADPVTELDRMEEYFIRLDGGPTNLSNLDGLLDNARHQMRDRRYWDSGGDY